MFSIPDHCKSMVDLADGDHQPTRTTESDSLYSEDCYSSGGDLHDPNIHIVVDGVTTGTSGTEDFGQRTEEYDAFLKEFYGGNIPSVRRRSFSPNEVNRQTDIPHASPTMLLDGEKRWVFQIYAMSSMMATVSNYCPLQGTPTVKPTLRGHSKRRSKIGFHDRLSLNAGQKYCRMLQDCNTFNLH